MAGFPRAAMPEVALVRRHFSSEKLDDVAGALRKELDKVNLAGMVKPGQCIAITAGSRGVDNIALVIKTIAAELKRAGASPFIVPAMGSHGGATAEGQVELIGEYGVTEEAMGCPILSSMDTVVIGKTPMGATVHMDRNAFESDGVIVVNRIKNHTSFRAPIESGLCKMMAIGLGKQRGAEAIHDYGMAPNIPPAAAVMIGTGKILLGVGTVENAYHKTYKVVACPAEKIHETDAEYLNIAAKLLPRVPFDDLDVLVIDQIGKNISGSGMDYNVVGMWRRMLEPPFRPMYTHIVVLDVTPESHGNCIGIGLSDFTTQRLVGKIDREKTYWNALTARAPMSARIPISLDTELEAVEVALRSARPIDSRYEMVRIRNTSELSEFYVTAPLLEQLAQDEYEVVRPLGRMPRDSEGTLLWG